MVEIHAPSSSRARSGRPRSTRPARILLRSSPAAFSVYVITRIDSTSIPSSHTARAKRSTSTFVLPVPAPAETNTSPRASTALCCSEFKAMSFIFVSRAKRRDELVPENAQHFSRYSCPPDPTHGPQLTPRGAVAALAIVPHVAGANSVDDPDGELA